MTVAGTKAASDAAAVQHEVLDFVRMQEGQQVPLDAIRKGVKRGNKQIGAALGMLVRDELLRVEGTGRKNDPKCYEPV